VTAAFLVLSVSCKKAAVDHGVTPTASFVRQFNASNQEEIYLKNSLFYAIWNKDLRTKWDSSLAQGSSSIVPYAGGWYPQVSGGTHVVNDSGSGLSPLAKYDTAFNAGKNLAANWEYTNHRIDSTHANAKWAGHCNGFSAASQRHAEPQQSVKRGNVTFTPKDIKALLAESHMNVKYLFLGGNRCELDESATLPAPINRPARTKLDACDDMNPGTFHIALTNWIGHMKHPVIMDVSAKEQVWNFPVYQYAFNYSDITREQAVEAVTGSKNDNYPFNSASKFVSVGIRVYYAAALGSEALMSDIADLEKRRQTRVYYYVLELSDQDEIIGGEWVGDSQQNHPDFMWVALEPTEGDGTPFSSNPFISGQEVIKLWAESVGQDPANPKLDILEPSYINNWGQFSKYTLSLDGLSGGAVMGSRDSTMTFARKSALDGEYTLKVTVDNKGVVDRKVTGNGEVKVTLPALARGLRVLQVDWMKGNAVADRQKMWVHVF
jgi:hypothetical protein